MKKPKPYLILLCLLATSHFLNAQVIGKIYVGDKPISVQTGPDHLEFEKSKSSLSDADEEYLKYFIDNYSKEVLARKLCLIILEPMPGATEENTLKKSSGVKRVDAISKYIRKESQFILKKAVMDGDRIVCSFTP